MFDYPIFEMPFIGQRMLMAINAIIHVFVSHGGAVGGSVILAALAWWANKRNDSYFDRINCNSQQQFSTLPSPFNNVLSSATPYSPFHYTPAPTQYGHNKGFRV